MNGFYRLIYLEWECVVSFAVLMDHYRTCCPSTAAPRCRGLHRLPHTQSSLHTWREHTLCLLLAGQNESQSGQLTGSARWHISRSADQSATDAISRLPCPGLRHHGMYIRMRHDQSSRLNLIRVLYDGRTG